MGRGGHFFLVILTTSAIIETISVRSKNNSLYVTISTALLSKRARVSCGDLCAAEAPTEAAAEKKCPLKKRADRPPFKVHLIPTVLYHYITVFASKITPYFLMTKRIKIISEKQPVKLDKQKIYAI